MKRFTGFAPLLLALVLAGLSWAGMDQSVQRIKVDGALSGAEKQEVMSLVAASIEGGILSSDIGKLSEALLELSWPRSVSVRRVWPDTLVIGVRKAAVIARWAEDEYLTTAGEAVTLAEHLEGLPVLNCAHAEPIDAMEMFRALMAAAQPLRLSVVGLEQNLLGEWTVRFDNGVVVSLGATQVTERMNRFVFAYASTLRNHEGVIAHVDARYANGLAVRFSELIAGNSVDAVGH